MSRFHDTTKKFQLLTKILKRYKVFPSSIACLWVNEHAWLSLFSESQSTRGVVEDKEALQQMKEQYPNTKLYAHSLTSFRFPSTMQMMYALQGQYEWLSTKKQREKVLQKCLDHLDPYGLLILDLYTSKAFDEKHLWEQVMVTDDAVVITKQSYAKWVVTKHEISFVKAWDLYRREEHKTSQMLLSLVDIKKLFKWFESVEFVDKNGRKANAKSKHVVVVAQKGR